MRLLIVAALSSVSLAGVSLRAQSRADSLAVVQLTESWWNTRDSKVYGSVFAPEAISLEPDGQVVHGRARLEREFAEELPDFKDYRVGGHRVTTVRFLSADLALVEGGFNVIGPKPPAWKYVYLGVIRRTRTGWQVEGASHIRVGGCC
jgi:ketosteroid isomerase-like protein